MKELFYLVLTLAIMESVFGIKVSEAIKDAASSASQGQPFSGQVERYFGAPQGQPSAIPGSSGEASGAGSILDQAKQLIPGSSEEPGMTEGDTAPKEAQ